MVKQRKAPIKVEPKVFFANERTFLAWMHVSIILAGASIAILAYSGNSDSPGSQLYGIVMLPVAVAFIVYAMYQCKLLRSDKQRNFSKSWRLCRLLILTFSYDAFVDYRRKACLHDPKQASWALRRHSRTNSTGYNANALDCCSVRHQIILIVAVVIISNCCYCEGVPDLYKHPKII